MKSSPYINATPTKKPEAEYWAILEWLAVWLDAASLEAQNWTATYNHSRAGGQMPVPKSARATVGRETWLR